ncbi:hypothetical protein CgunFtcFv8_010776 [Champsocephalus gunnari]|uniref:Uncharacterized protein n=1 Tax=Champsocephalus gunnari TaxID=52237 RepID=A0AAN8DZP5_CHAGU|nr:hypothetical protein CgunFtcFv8_010776 [Champsocephalus gunnari]
MRSNSALCSAASSVLSDWSSFRIGGVSKSSPSSEPSSPDSLPLLCPLVSVWKTGLESESVPLILPLCGGSWGNGQVLQFYSEARRAGIQIIQGLDQNISGYSRVQQGAEELVLQGCQLGYHFREH